jgi:glycerol uptake facilitator-like aquaporin
MFMKNKMEVNLFIAYVLAQLIGAALAVRFDNFIITRT